MHYYLGDYDKAEQALGDSIEMAPNDHLHWSNLGDVLWNSGKQDEARDAFVEGAREDAGIQRLRDGDLARHDQKLEQEALLREDVGHGDLRLRPGSGPRRAHA